MIKRIKIGDREYGFVEGPKGYIITNDECIHRVFEPDAQPYDDITLQQMRDRCSALPVSMFEWVHYWGIKQRMAGNYALLLKSMREIGLSTKDMPKWGEDDRPKTVAA